MLLLLPPIQSQLLSAQNEEVGCIQFNCYKKVNHFLFLSLFLSFFLITKGVEFEDEDEERGLREIEREKDSWKFIRQSLKAGAMYIQKLSVWLQGQIASPRIR